jgi:cytidine deaminase
MSSSTTSNREDDEILSDSLTDELESPEIFFALVGAIGTDLDKVYDILKKVLQNEVKYKVFPVKLTDIISSATDREEPDRYTRYLKKMKSGTETRRHYKRADACILKSLTGVRAFRRDENKQLNLSADVDLSELPLDNAAFVFNSLKRPEEVDTLRRLYGQSFFLIGAYSPRESRVRTLARRIADSREKQNSNEFRPQAEELIEKDRADQGEDLGQAVQKTFPEADIFINIDDELKSQQQLTRFVRLIFGDAFFTPSKEEQAMFFAKAAALRSADLGRQVGAVISSPKGDLLAIGTNEVPAAGGGQYWENDPNDKRDFRLRYDSNDQMRKRLIGDISANLSSQLKTLLMNFSQQIQSESCDMSEFENKIDLLNLNSFVSKSVSKSQMTNLIAYFRAVHAEMSALMDAARRGVPVTGMTLVCTTFPCHECARHVIAAGIKKVVFIEPYAKSLTTELYGDSVVVDSPHADESFVHFCPFVGIAPRQFMNLFDASRIDRKSNGIVVEWTAESAKPRKSEAPQAYIFKETKRLHFIDAFDRRVKEEMKKDVAK